MTRIPLDPPRSTTYRLSEWWSRRSWGLVAAPAAAMGHHPGVLRGTMRHEMGVARWHRLDPTLKALAQIAAAATVGCAWCLDFGFWESTRQGIDPRKLRDVPRWSGSDAYTDLERRVMAYAEAMSTTPPAVTDEQVAALRRELDDAALVELTMVVAVENQRARFNDALGLPAQGFRDRCEVPAR